MKKVVDVVRELAEPVVQDHGCELWDVEFQKEAGQWFLRLYIDKDGGVGIDDCEAVSRALDPVLDQADPIETAYVFEVSSAGVDRALKRPRDFEKFLGHEVDVRLYMAKDGSKVWTGTLQGFQDGDVTILVGKNTMTFRKAEIAVVRLAVRF